MAGPYFRDRVQETTATTGTGTLDLAGAVSGFQTFVNGVGTGNETFYTIVDSSTGAWEVGRGTVTDASPDTLSRTTILASSNSGATVNFSAGTKNVFVTIPAAVFADAYYNFLINSSFEVWGDGTASAPTLWSQGTNGAFAKNTTSGEFKIGSASAQITRSTANANLQQNIANTSRYGPIARWQGKRVAFGCWVRATVAGTARLRIDDGVDTSNSSFHSGGGGFEFLQVSHAVNASATVLEAHCRVDTTASTAQFDGAVFVEGTYVHEWIPSGWVGRKSVLELNCNSVSMSTNSTNYFGSHIHTASESAVQVPVPFKSVARNMFTVISSAAGSGGSWTLTLRKNSADTSLAVSGVTTSTSSDATDEVSIAKGDLLAVRSVPTGTVSSSPAIVIIELEEFP